MKIMMNVKVILLIVVVLALSNTAWAKTVTLSWDASPSEVTGYTVYYDTESSASLEGVGSPIDVGNVQTYIINGLPDDVDHYFAVIAYDSSGNESTYSNIVHSPPVSSGNAVPVISSIQNQSILEGATLNFSVSATDSDGDTLIYSSSNLPSGAGINPTSGDVTWTPGFSQSGIYSVIFSVSDGIDSISETVQITVADLNRSPVLNPIGTQTIGENVNLAFTISGSDPDDDALSFSVEDLPEGASFDEVTRSFSWTPEYQASENMRVVRVTFKVSDGEDEDTELVTINVTNVNRAPIIDPIVTQALTGGIPYDLVVNATDPDNNSITYSVVVEDLPQGAVFNSVTQSLNWIPGNDQVGSYDITFTASDGSLSDSETVTFVVSYGSEAPVLEAIGPQSISENSELTFVASASDQNGDSLEFHASGVPEGAEFDIVQKRFRWTPDFSQAGSFNVTITVTDGSLSDSENVEITVVNSNRVPQISGTPNDSVMATASYSFVPTVSDPDGDPLTYSVANMPSWATFNPSSGELSGVPTETDLGSSSGIVVTVNDANDSQSLPPFSIDVIAYVHQDSDGDGILDHLDAFPNDSGEWLDTDGDQIGNNSDFDDDNDGIADVRDGFPLDSSQSGWTITATAGEGGYITPEGNSSILYGGSQSYLLTPMGGYYINDLLVDNVSVGLIEGYRFENVGSHHTISAVFAPIPSGLSHDPMASGLVGIERFDGGDDSSNLVDGKPKQDIDYRFQVVFRDSVAADQRRVFVSLDNYKYEMQISEGALTSGADYIYTTRLGASMSHRFYFSVEDLSGQQLWRYPLAEDLPGPSVHLLNGKNMVGVIADINAYALDAIEVFNDSQVYRWDPQGEQFLLVDAGAPVASGEGYVLKRNASAALPDLSTYGELPDSIYEFQVKSGWNLISNPYGGNVSLTDVAVRVSDDAPVPWLSAVESNLVVDVIYSYLGSDWGGVNEFSSASGSSPAILIPWIGYWVYVNPTELPISLLLYKPLQ